MLQGFFNYDNPVWRFAGRLGGYKYYDMDKAIAAAFDLVESELGVRL